MIQISDIKKTYISGDNKVEALKGVSINFRENEFVSILGQSGCGKTTLLNILGGLDRYDSGDIVINNKSTKEFKDKDWDTYRNHYIGFIFQSYNLIPHLNVLENVEIALTIAGLGKKEKRELAVKALTRVGLFDQLKKKPNQLSGGQMQRVAIARAIVNNPKIILADEPTGALDSETSIQIMDLLKEIAGDHLIIMVTHNKEIADKYSSRIINLLDGEVVGDTNPYTPSKKEKTPKVSKNIQNNQKNDKKAQKNRSSMGFFTAFMLSLKNLISKKGRTFMTSFAGSIGIIGIALVLAVSNGFTSYIGQVQSDALGNYPLTVCAISMDMNKFTSTDTQQDDKGDEDVDDDMITPYNPLTRFVQYGHYNNITTEFVNKIKEFEKQDKLNGNTKLNAVNYNYYLPIKFITKKSNNEYTFIKKQNSTSILSADTSSAMNPMLDNVDFCLEQYDLIYGSLPQKQTAEPFTTQMLLVVGKGNKIPFTTLAQIGIDTPTDEMEQYKKISIEDIVAKEYKLILNDDYYTPDAEELENITSFSKLDITSQTELETAYQNATYTCKICGVLRLKDEASEVLKPGLVYMRDFEEFYAQNCKDSIISQKEELNRQNGNYTLYDPYEIQVSEIEILPPFGSVQAINFFLQAQYGYSLSNEEAFELALQQIGTSKIPVNIKFYPKNFAAKKEIISLINDYNSTKDTENQKIVYSDASEFLTSTLGQLVEIISYVLIAFAAISLIVSSIMISIITYVSVIERTKEIGVLRSIGARKKDITRVFNAETLIIGMLAGLLGVLVSYVLSIPINAIIISVADGAITSNIAVLAPLTALILIGISIILTVLAGFIPAIMASKQDPVKALRTE